MTTPSRLSPHVYRSYRLPLDPPGLQATDEAIDIRARQSTGVGLVTDAFQLAFLRQQTELLPAQIAQIDAASAQPMRWNPQRITCILGIRPVTGGPIPAEMRDVLRFHGVERALAF